VANKFRPRRWREKRDGPRHRHPLIPMRWGRLLNKRDAKKVSVALGRELVRAMRLHNPFIKLMQDYGRRLDVKWVRHDTVQTIPMFGPAIEEPQGETDGHCFSLDDVDGDGTWLARTETVPLTRDMLEDEFKRQRGDFQ
jgi:hypothetical protein